MLACKTITNNLNRKQLNKCLKVAERLIEKRNQTNVCDKRE